MINILPLESLVLGGVSASGILLFLNRRVLGAILGGFQTVASTVMRCQHMKMIKRRLQEVGGEY